MVGVTGKLMEGSKVDTSDLCDIILVYSSKLFIINTITYDARNKFKK